MLKIKPNLSTLYISPLEQCNLACKMCYTCKTRDQLTDQQIIDFVDRYCQSYPLEMITFCGGEVFLLDWFVDAVNNLTQLGLVVEIITNGTIDNLEEIKQPNLVNMIISLDGLERDHDLNRGTGQFQKSWKFLKKAKNLGFHFEIFTVVSAHNFNQLEDFENWLQDQLGELPTITYHPRKPPSYLEEHPLSNRFGEVDNFAFLTESQLVTLSNSKQVFPPLNLGCHQLSLMSDGFVYGCCEGFSKIGKITDPIEQLVGEYEKRLSIPDGCDNDCLGCVEQNFVCGLKK